MNTIIGLEDLKICYEKSNKIGKWEAWKEHYFKKYEEVFSLMLKYLYLSDVESLKPFVESFNFEKAIQTTENIVTSNKISEINSLIEKSKSCLKFSEDFSLCLLVGIGHVDGTSLPSKTPFLYLGLERLDESNLEMLVPHEFNHLVRGCAGMREINQLALLPHLIFFLY